jgi:hypothetical protein
MSPGITQVSWAEDKTPLTNTHKGTPRNIEPIKDIQWDKSLHTKKYEFFGTHPESKILFLDVNILDSTGKEPYRGDVYIEGMLTPLPKYSLESAC